MRITAVDTIVSPVQPNVCVVRVHSDDDVIGLGETFYGAPSVEAYIHQQAAPILFELSDCSPESAALALRPYVGYQGSGAETRGNSAIDIALWDALGHRSGLPLRELLGGAVTDSIPTYNTCAGSHYVNGQSRQSSSNWGLPVDEVPQGPFEDLWGFMHEPARLARELRDSGVPGMKVWPFDLAAEESRGDHRADLRPGLKILEAIRGEVGADVELYLELHSMWTLRGSERLLRAVEEFQPTWVEDPMRADDVHAIARLHDDASVPIAAGETLAGQRGYKPLLDAGAIDVAIVDVGWTGGLTEAKKIAALAGMYGVPIAPHDCTGPISLAAAVHFVTSIPNGMVQEMSRAFYHGWYQEFVTELPPIVDGRIRPLAGPGLGVQLHPDILDPARSRIRSSAR